MTAIVGQGARKETAESAYSPPTRVLIEAMKMKFVNNSLIKTPLKVLTYLFYSRNQCSPAQKRMG